MHHVAIKSIKRIGIRPTIDLKVGKYHNFFLDNGILTHNSGKSSFAILTALLWCKKLDIKFHPRKHIVYTNEQLMHALDTLPPFSPIIADEAINFCLTENWAKSENKELKKKLAQVRTKHFFFIMCFPLKINKVEQTYLESFVNYWIDIFTRGQGVIFTRDANPAHDAWRIKDFKDLGSYNEFSSPETIKKKLAKHPNFWKLMNIPPLPTNVYAKYLKIREKNVYTKEDATRLLTREEAIRGLLVQVLQDIMMKDGSITPRRLVIHIRNEYDIEITEKEIAQAIKDSTDLLKRCLEIGIVGNISKKENAESFLRLAKQAVMPGGSNGSS